MVFIHLFQLLLVSIGAVSIITVPFAQSNNNENQDLRKQIFQFSGDFLKRQQLLKRKEFNQRKRSRRSEILKKRPRIVELCKSRSQCTGNTTTFDYVNNFNCFCDNVCFEYFHDCCPDYEKQCGRQNRMISKEKLQAYSAWKCVNLGLKYQDGCKVSRASGVWMIQECPLTWPSDETKRKCHKPPHTFSHPVEDYVPVIGENQFTYRNKHCAVCHGVRNYTSWSIRVRTFIVPPEKYDLDTKLRFITENGGLFQYVGPTNQQPRRYCAGKRYTEECPDTSHKDYEDCVNGPVEVVGFKSYFKNEACASCHGQPYEKYWPPSTLCGGVLGEGFAIVFQLSNQKTDPASKIVSKNCPAGLVYDENLEFCRKAYVTTASDNLSGQFMIAVWFGLSAIAYNSTSVFERNFRTALTEGFSLMPNQISAATIHSQDLNNNYLAFTFRLTLTPIQDLILANQHNSNNTDMLITDKSKKFLKLLNFTGNFTIRFNQYRFPVIKMVSKQLACFGGRKLRLDEYELDNDKGRLFDNKTKKYISLREYSILEGNGGNITICRKIVLSDCDDGAYVPLKRNEFVLLPNLALYHNASNRTFDFGEYIISEDSNDGNSNPISTGEGEITNSFSNMAYVRNATFAICLPFQSSYNLSETQHKRNSYSIQVVTFVGFTVSIICLLLLLITYGIFTELRTLPGLNLMSLSLSLLVSHLFWLIGTAHFQMTTLCIVLAILQHYLFLVSFLAMSVISYHSCHVFSKPFIVPEQTKAYRTYVKYTVIVWVWPAIYVAICVILDKTGTFPIDYGFKCWLGTDKAKLYLFLLPIALLLLFNVCTFICTAVSLTRFHKNSPAFQKKRKQNLLVCVKLSTLVGFPWVFAFIGVLFPDVEAFEYLFAIFACLQGLYIGAAFLSNPKIRKLYENRWRHRKDVGGTALPREDILTRLFQVIIRWRS